MPFPLLPTCAVLAALTLMGLITPLHANPGDAELGRRLYVYGERADGSPVTGTTQGDVPIAGRAFACANCHRPSGFGASEGGNFVPPIIGPVLFQPRVPDRNERFRELYQEVQPSTYWARVRQARMRPAYDEALLARALRHGVDAGGNELDRVMPRYDLSDTDVANLEAYLHGLSATLDPGVDAKTLHIATIFAPDVDPAERDAVLRTQRVFVDWMNIKTAGDRQNPTFSPNFKSDFLPSYRNWQLHVWDLEGPSETWPEQLAKFYADQPVFVVMGGVVPGPWDRIGAFCDAKRLPCILPETELPGVKDTDNGYTIFFSRGLMLEADVMAGYLADLATLPKRIVQLHATGARGARPAVGFEAAMARLMPDVALETRAYADAGSLAAALDALTSQGPDGTRPDTLVIWPDDPEAAVAAIAAHAPPGVTVMLPSDAMISARSLPDTIAANTLITWPYEGPDGYHPRQYEVRAWMHSRRLKVDHPRVQLQTYYGLTLLQYGLMHAIGDFHRDYLVEIIEHEAENDLNPGTHPALALGPGQRIASKGAFVVTPAKDTRAGYRVISDWIIPGW